MAVSVGGGRVCWLRTGVEPTLAAAHSSGEWSSHVIAGETLSFADALRRGQGARRAMQKAVPAGEGAMPLVLALDAAQWSRPAEEAARETRTRRASREPQLTQSGPVISGAAAAVEKSRGVDCKARGARATVMLPSGGLLSIAPLCSRRRKK